MSRTYITKQGDMWDGIAYEQLGGCQYVDALMNANPEHIETYVFSNGVELDIPEVQEAKTSDMLPPWKKVIG